VLVDRHPAGGYLNLAVKSDLVALCCHWPFDVEDDQWIDIKNCFSVSSYLLAVGNAISDGGGEAPGIAGGFLRIRSLKDGFAIEFSRPQAGWSASSLQLHVRRPIGELLLPGSDGIDEPGPAHLPHHLATRADG
jgi:hypothetical protein